MNLEIIRGLDINTQQAYVKRCIVDDEGSPVGVPHDNPRTDLRQYEVEFLDGEAEIMTVNQIAESILSHVDDYGHMHMVLDEIEDHRVLSNTIPKDKCTYTTKQGTIQKSVPLRGETYFLDRRMDQAFGCG